MKALLFGLMVGCMAGSVPAADKAELDQRVRTLTAKLETLQLQPEKRIPAETLRKAQGIILLDRTKAGFIFAYQGGSGVALVRDPKTDAWSPAAFLAANEASLGFQVGGEQSFFAILLMDTNATRRLADSKFEFGGEARGTAGAASAGAAGTVSNPEQSILVYDDRKGLYGGAAIKGGAIAPDHEANRVYYEQFVTMQNILFEHKVKPTPATQELVAKLTDYSRATKP